MEIRNNNQTAFRGAFKINNTDEKALSYFKWYFAKDITKTNIRPNCSNFLFNNNHEEEACNVLRDLVSSTFTYKSTKGMTTEDFEAFSKLDIIA